MLHPTDAPLDDPSAPLTKEDVTRHFPSDFDCSQLLFSNEQFLWVQYVPRFRRHLPAQLFAVLIRHAFVIGMALILILIGVRINSNVKDSITHSVKTEYVTSSVIFFILEIVMIFKDFGGYSVDIATNIRMMHAVIYPTLVSCETISYKSIEKTMVRKTHLLLALRAPNRNKGFLQSIRRKLFVPKFFLPYIPENNAWILVNIASLISNSMTESATLEQTEDAIRRLEDNTPSKNTEIPEKYGKLVEAAGDDLLWGYTPSPFEKKRSTLIQLVIVLSYFALVTIGLVMPVLTVLTEYSPSFSNFVLIIWLIYFVTIVLMDTEFNEMVTLNATSIASFTTRLTFFGKCPKFVQCGKRITRLSYASAYPLYSYLYRTPNSTPTDYKLLRTVQGLEAKILGYTDGSGAIQFPNNLTLRVPNVHDVECAILQKHYQMWRAAAQAGGQPVEEPAGPPVQINADSL